jgi:hypothetical protein
VHEEAKCLYIPSQRDKERAVLPADMVSLAALIAEADYYMLPRLSKLADDCRQEVTKFSLSEAQDLRLIYIPFLNISQRGSLLHCRRSKSGSSPTVTTAMKICMFPPSLLIAAQSV